MPVEFKETRCKCFIAFESIKAFFGVDRGVSISFPFFGANFISNNLEIKLAMRPLIAAIRQATGKERCKSRLFNPSKMTAKQRIKIIKKTKMGAFFFVLFYPYFYYTLFFRFEKTFSLKK